MNKDEIESIINGDGAYSVVEQGGWVIGLDTHTYEGHIVQCGESLKFYNLVGYVRRAPHWLYNINDAYLIEVVPIEKRVVHWRKKDGEGED